MPMINDNMVRHRDSKAVERWGLPDMGPKILTFVGDHACTNYRQFKAAGQHALFFMTMFETPNHNEKMDCTKQL